VCALLRGTHNKSIKDALVTETLATHKRITTAFQGTLEDLTWSADARWLLAKVNYENVFPTPMGGNPKEGYYAVNPSTGQSVDWEARLGIPYSPTKGDIVNVGDASWISGTGHRLLLWALKWKAMGSDLLLPEDGSPSPPQGQWMIYDIDTGLVEAVKDLPSYEQGFGSVYVGLVWSTQGKYLGVNQGAVSAEEYQVTWR
jgi:hypothetical protein